jgi:hypothetical protein
MVQENPSPQNSLAPSDQGSRIEGRATVRKLRELVVYPHEIDHVSLLNSLTASFASAASASLAFVIGLVTNALMQDRVSERAQGMLWVGVPAGLLLTLVFTIAAVWALRTRMSASDELKNQAVDIEQDLPAPVTPAQ